MALERAADIEVLGEAPDADMARIVTEQMAPDVVVLGMQLPPIGGVRAAAALRELVPRVQIALTLDLDGEGVEGDVQQAVRAGVSGFISRDVIPTEAPALVQALAGGRPVLPSRAAAAVVGDYDAISVGGSEGGTLLLESRERALLECLAEGKRLSAAALELGLGPMTASNLVANTLQKLHRYARLVGPRTAGRQADDRSRPGR